MSKTDWSNAKYADSKELLKWLFSWYPDGEEGLVRDLSYSNRWSRRLYAWRSQEFRQIDVATTLDAFCVELGLHLSELPDEVFHNEARRKKRRPPVDEKDARKIVQIYKKEGTKAAAEAMNCTVQTVRKYVREYA